MYCSPDTVALCVLTEQRQNERLRNKKEQHGLMAVHPDKGVFVGDIAPGIAKFIAIEDLVEGQSIPVGYCLHDLNTVFSNDPTIHECDIYRIPVQDSKNDVIYAEELQSNEAKSALSHKFTNAAGMSRIGRKFKNLMNKCHLYGDNHAYQDAVHKPQP